MTTEELERIRRDNEERKAPHFGSLFNHDEGWCGPHERQANADIDQLLAEIEFWRTAAVATLRNAIRAVNGDKGAKRLLHEAEVEMLSDVAAQRG